MNRSQVRQQSRIKLSVTKKSTNKLVDRLTYSPKKHKQKFANKLRSKLQNKAAQPKQLSEVIPESLIFASFNVNGLSLETTWAVEQLLKERNYDVSKV